MSHEAERLLLESMRLPLSERANLIASLLASLEPSDGSTEELDAAWIEELEKRRSEALSGVAFDDWQTVRQAALDRLGRRR